MAVDTPGYANLPQTPADRWSTDDPKTGRGLQMSVARPILPEPDAGRETVDEEAAPGIADG